MKLSTALLPGLLLGVGFSSLARADVPPSPDYVEQCTVAKEQGPGAECVVCGDAYHGDVDACEKKHATDGYARRCRTSGASVWSEVWCRASAVAAPEPGPEVAPKPDRTADKAAAPSPAGGKAGGGGCSVGAGGVTGEGWLLAVLGLVLAGVRRRRRR